jgi:hypothetical protein
MVKRGSNTPNDAMAERGRRGPGLLVDLGVETRRSVGKRAGKRCFFNARRHKTKNEFRIQKTEYRIF